MISIRHANRRYFKTQNFGKNNYIKNNINLQLKEHVILLFRLYHLY